MPSPRQTPHAALYLKRAGSGAMERAVRFVRDIVLHDARSMESKGARPGWYHSLPAFKGEIHQAIEELDVRIV